MLSSAIISFNETTQKNTNAQYIENIEVTEENMNVLQLVFKSKDQVIKAEKI